MAGRNPHPVREIVCARIACLGHGRALVAFGMLETLSDTRDSGGLLAAYAHLSPALVRFVIARGASAAEAEDLVQDLGVKLIEQPTGASVPIADAPIADPRAYLYRMAHNLFLDQRRAATRRERRESDWVDATSQQPPSIETQLIDRDQLQQVTEALTHLPERTVEVLRRYRIDGETQKAIASSIGISVSAIEKHLQRAYRALLEMRPLRDADCAPPRRLGAKGKSDE